MSEQLSPADEERRCEVVARIRGTNRDAGKALAPDAEVVERERAGQQEEQGDGRE